jgi:hypothetical protein
MSNLKDKNDQIECIKAKTGKRIFLARHLTEDARFLAQNGIVIAPAISPIKEYKPKAVVVDDEPEFMEPATDANGDAIPAEIVHSTTAVPVTGTPKTLKKPGRKSTKK